MTTPQAITDLGPAAPVLTPVQYQSHHGDQPLIGDRYLTRLWTGGRWLEGPAYFPASRYLVFSDVPNDRVLRYDELTGGVSELYAPASFANGHTIDQQGRLLSAEHGTRRVSRVEHDGAITTLADSYLGKRLNSPNDLVVDQKDAVWFTDPTYGIISDFEGHAADQEQACQGIYRVVPGQAPVLMDPTLTQPNGLAFSPHGNELYVADSHLRQLYAYTVTDTQLTDRRLIATCPDGTYDGLRVDRDGRLWISSGEGVDILTGQGKLLGRLTVGEVVSNLCFGGPRGLDLYLTATTSLYVIRLRHRAR